MWGRAVLEFVAANTEILLLRLTAAFLHSLPARPPTLPLFLVCAVLSTLLRRQRDVLALTLRGRRQAALGPEATAAVDDYPEETKAQQAGAVQEFCRSDT